MRNKILLGLACSIVLSMLVTVTSQAFGVESTLRTHSATAPAPRTAEVLVFFEPGTDATAFGEQHGLTFLYKLRSANAAVFRASSADDAERFVHSAFPGGVLSAYLNSAAAARPAAFVPNDPYFHRDTPTSGFAGQWNLTNEFTSGLDANVEGAWARDLTGTGVVIGIVDDGIEISHPDLSPNYQSAYSWDFGEDNNDPSPVWDDDNHGTAVAGIAAARGGNSVGVTGAAPNAGLAGLRIDFVSPTVAQFVDATLYHSSGSNTQIGIKNHSYSHDPFVEASAEREALQTSASAGTIHVFSSGNDGQDSNKLDLQNSPNVITVGAVGANGTFPGYSNFGANLFVCAPSDSSSPYPGITTADRQGAAGYNADSDDDDFPDTDYTSTFGGTSAAAPAVAGVIALGKQIRPNMDVRFAKHLLALSSTLIDPTDETEWSDGGWRTNAAGLAFNQNYGFGLVNADRFTELAAQYTGVSPLVTENTGTIEVGEIVPDDDLAGITQTFDITTVGKLEEVLVTFDVTQTYRGDLEAYLTSPSGSTRRLFKYSGADYGDTLQWTFLSNAFWGENAAGEWSLQLADIWGGGDQSLWNSFSAEVRMGDLEGEAIPEPATLTLVGLGAVGLLGALRRRRMGR